MPISCSRDRRSGQVSSGGLPTLPNRFDMAVIAATALALAAWVAGPANAIAAGLLIAAGALQFVRLVRWAGMKALSDPLVFVLHLSYAWLPTGFVLLGRSEEHTSELQSLMRISYAVFCLK